MARGDSYQLQGQQGGVYLSGAQAAVGEFRVLLALSDTVVSSMTSNFKNSAGFPVTGLTIPARVALGGQFKDVTITSGSVVCYYA